MATSSSPQQLVQQEDEREKLESFSRSQTLRAAMVMRARIVLLVSRWARECGYFAVPGNHTADGASGSRRFDLFLDRPPWHISTEVRRLCRIPRLILLYAAAQKCFALLPTVFIDKSIPKSVSHQRRSSTTIIASGVQVC
jgi:hypothetical protein